MKGLKATDKISFHFETLKQYVFVNTYAFSLQSLLKYTDSYEQGT